MLRPSLPESSLDIIDIDDIIDGMASITIRGLDPKLKERLRVQAARHGRSMEDEARVILRQGVGAAGRTVRGLGTAIHRRFQEVGGVELQLPAREPMREPPKFS